MRQKKKDSSRLALIRAMIIVAVCGIAALALVVARLYEIQITNHTRFEGIALANQLRETTISAQRGAIFDVNGQMLAMSTASENVFLSPLELAEFEEHIPFIAQRLSEILDIDADFILERARRYPSQFEVIARNVSPAQSDAVRRFRQYYRIRGIYFEPSAVRNFPNNRLASHIIGIVGAENIGLEGIERRYDRYLTGVHGREVRIRNARGTDMHFSEFEDFFDARNGNNIFLTIDANVQRYVEMRLWQAVEDYDVQNGATAIAMNVNTGAILGMASYPTFDPNDFGTLSERDMRRIELIYDDEKRADEITRARFRQRRNIALSDTYEPGSVFKMITMAMALEENIADLDTYFYCYGSMEIVGRLDEDGEPIPIHCHNRFGHGRLTLDRAMQYSCNIAFIELGLRLGAERFYSYIDAFGLFERTGLDNLVESGSIWWDERTFIDPRNQSQLAAASFGQTFKVTPIQMITALAATVNGGYLMQPHMISRITDSDGNIVRVTEPTVVRQVISAESSARIRASLENAVERGTGRNAQVRGFRVGGKTGTSENIEQLTLWEDPEFKEYIVSFAGFAPADNPEIIVLVLLDTPSNESGVLIRGGTMAAPVVGNIFSDILQLHLGMLPQFTEEDLRHINIQVPRLSGQTVEAASELLLGQAFGVEIVGAGVEVTGQLPAAHSMVAPGTTVKLFAGENVPRNGVRVPCLAGMSYEQAKNALEDRGLFINTVGLLRSDPRAEVSIQSIGAELYTIIGSVVEVTLIDRRAT